ncbi:MAG: iron-sulfur cluster biosynthesis transcriptional regulator SufR [Cyanobacteria bacterium K_Offshore_surface_m2_239]|nr:iron-sulfur cluster biosynthesis transcriptional regulator SufR [Cyanobacteria bacterium K_Offshore_surface_m2_239]
MSVRHLPHHRNRSPLASHAISGAEAPADEPPLATRDAVLALLLRRGEATAADLAASLGVSVQAMRRHLRSLEEDALVESSTSSAGPGRPTNHWRLTHLGQERFGDGSETFALGLLQSMAATLPADTVSNLMEQQAEEKARVYRTHIGVGPLEVRLERLTELRRSEGYVADLGPDPSAGPDRRAWLIREHHCSVMRIAEEFPQVCDQELLLLRLTFPDCQVDRVHWRLQEGHSCGFRLQPQPKTQSPSGTHSPSKTQPRPEIESQPRDGSSGAS